MSGEPAMNKPKVSAPLKLSMESVKMVVNNPKVTAPLKRSTEQKMSVESAVNKPKVSAPVKQSMESVKTVVNNPKVSAPLKQSMEPVMSTKFKIMASPKSMFESLKPAATAVKQIISKPLKPATIPLKLPARQEDTSNKLMSVPMKTPKNTELSSSMPATTSKSSFQLSSETAATSTPVLETTMKLDKPISNIVKPAKLQLKPQNEAIARKRLCSSEEIEAKKIRAIETKHKKQFEKEALEMDAPNKETYAIIMSEEKKTLEEEVQTGKPD